MVTRKTPNRFYVYALWVAGDRNPFYIGKGQGDRCYIHFKESSLCANTLKNNIIKKAYRLNKHIHIYTLDDNLLESEAFACERAWVKHYGRRDLGTGCLANLTDGGDGVSGRIFSDTQKAVISAASRKRWEDATYRKNIIGHIRARWADPDYKAEHARIMKEALSTPTARGRRSAASTRRWTDVFYRENIVGHINARWADPAERKLQSARTKKLWRDPAYRTKQILAATERWADPNYKARLRRIQLEAQRRPELRAAKSRSSKEYWANPAARSAQRVKQLASWTQARRDEKGEFWTDYWSNPANRRRQSEAHRVGVGVYSSLLSIHNPLFTMTSPHCKPRHSAITCRWCNVEEVVRNSSLMTLPTAHRQCAVDAFGEDPARMIYKTLGANRRSLGYGLLIDGTPKKVAFNFKFAIAGVIFYDDAGEELSRIRLPREYTKARIHIHAIVDSW